MEDVMKAITTKFHGPSNIKGSRYSASDEDGNRVILSSEYALNSAENHARAATALLDKMQWSGRMVGGSTKHGMVWVFVDNSPTILRGQLKAA